MAMAFWRCDRLYLAVHDSTPPTDREWSRWLTLCGERARSEMRCLVETRGGGPNPRQRKQLTELLDNKDQLRVGILTESMVVRGIITALSWAGLPIHSFAPSAHEQACEWLALSAIERQQVREELPHLRNEIRTSSALHMAAP